MTQYSASGGDAEGVPGKPGVPMPPAGVPPSEGVGNLPDTQLPGQSVDVPQPGGTPGQENMGPADGMITTSPMPEEQGPGLIFNRGQELFDRAKDLGYSQRIPPQKAPFDSHGQPVFWNGKQYITPDVDAHNVANGWKVFDRHGDRVGTYDENLNWVKK